LRTKLPLLRLYFTIFPKKYQQGFKIFTTETELEKILVIFHTNTFSSECPIENKDTGKYCLICASALVRACVCVYASVPACVCVEKMFQ